jgi:uncharacterized repeat protein (TIGR01451 family)
MKIVSVRRRLILAAIAVCASAVVVFNFIPKSEAENSAILPPSINATKAISFPAGAGGDVNGDGNADPGDTITYTVTINNAAAPGAGNDATGVIFTDTLQSETTLVANSVNSSPIIGNEAFNVTGNVSISVPDGSSGERHRS